MKKINSIIFAVVALGCTQAFAAPQWKCTGQEPYGAYSAIVESIEGGSHLATAFRVVEGGHLNKSFSVTPDRSIAGSVTFNDIEGGSFSLRIRINNVGGPHGVLTLPAGTLETMGRAGNPIHIPVVCTES